MEQTKLSKRQMFIAIVCALGFTGHCGICYLVHSYYSLFQTVCGFTDAQLGQVMSMVGGVATISYFVGGFLADMVRPKVLLMFSYASVFGLSLFLLTFPPFKTFFIIFVFIAVLTLAPFWCPLSKFMAAEGGEKSGKMMGTFFGFLSCLMSAPDVVTYNIAGNLITKHGDAGYKMIFSACFF